MNIFELSFTRIRDGGFALPVLLITTMMLSLMIIAVASSASLTYNLSSNETYKVNAQFAVDAGIDKALVELTLDATYAGTTTAAELYNNGTIRTTYEITVFPGADNDRRVIRATGRTYGAPTTRLRSTRSYEVDAQGINSGTGLTSVVSGVGGLTLNSNAKISGGDVIVNGTITVDNNAQIGLQTNPVNVRVAHQSCPVPPNATYPQVCASGENGQPITIDVNGKIYAEVHATNQTNGTNMFDPGLIPNQTFPPTSLPAYDRDAQKAAVTTTVPPTDASVACGNNGSVTWPGNLKITGNMSLGNNCTVTLSGNTWITGNLVFGNNSRIIVANSLGTTRPTIMVDGSNGIDLNNNAQVIPNSSDTGVYFLTSWANSSCSPDCTNLTGPDLANSQSIRTIILGNGSTAQNSILYSRWSKIIVSNNGAIGAVAGQTVELGNNANISFTSSLPGSGTNYTTWIKRGYMRVY
jgi:Tfp pilus assembly protein PilX